jgi:hypothetical protein
MDFPGAMDSLKKSFAVRESLLQTTPEDQALLFNVEETQSAIAGVYAAMALHSHVPTKELQYCRESGSWFRKALPFWLQKKAQGKLSASETDALAENYKSQEKCDRIIARLNHATASSRP